LADEETSWRHFFLAGPPETAHGQLIRETELDYRQFFTQPTEREREECGERREGGGRRRERANEGRRWLRLPSTLQSDAPREIARRNIINPLLEPATPRELLSLSLSLFLSFSLSLSLSLSRRESLDSSPGTARNI